MTSILYENISNLKADINDRFQLTICKMFPRSWNLDIMNPIYNLLKYHHNIAIVKANQFYHNYFIYTPVEENIYNGTFQLTSTKKSYPEKIVGHSAPPYMNII